MEVVSASAVIAYIAEVQIETVLRYLFYVVTTDTIDTETLRGDRIGAVNPVQAVVAVVIKTPVAVIPKEERGRSFQQRVQQTYFCNINDNSLIFATAVVDGGIGKMTTEKSISSYSFSTVSII